jgi:lipid-binding SYLF domain-containing protein
MQHRTITVLALLAASLGAASLTACQSDYNKRTEYQENRSSMERDARDTINEFKAADSSLDRFFREAAGYAVFPVVAKGGAIVGGAHGDGVVFQNGQLIGFAELSQGSVGAQIGGQTYSEIIFFETVSALNAFKSGSFAFAGNASAVAIQSGAAAAADYKDGVAVFTKPRAGLMLEASIGGQEFEFYPL